MVASSTHGVCLPNISTLLEGPMSCFATDFVEVWWWWTNSLSSAFSINEAQEMADKPCAWTAWLPGGHGKAKCWFQLLKKCLKRESNPRLPVCRASMLTIRPWCACGAVTTCVWSAYGLCPSHFDCLCWEGIQLTRMNCVRGSALAFCSGGRWFNSCLWWTYSMPMHEQRQPMVDRQSDRRLRPGDST